MHRLRVPSIMRSLAGKCTASYRDPEKMLQECKDALPPYLIAELKRVMNHHNPTKFVVHVIIEQHRKARAYDNHASVANNIPKVECSLNKEYRNKNVAVFPCWLERFFQHLYLTPQGLIGKESKSDRLVFDGSFLETPFLPASMNLRQQQTKWNCNRG